MFLILDDYRVEGADAIFKSLVAIRQNYINEFSKVFETQNVVSAAASARYEVSQLYLVLDLRLGSRVN